MTTTDASVMVSTSDQDEPFSTNHGIVEVTLAAGVHQTAACSVHRARFAAGHAGANEVGCLLPEAADALAGPCGAGEHPDLAANAADALAGPGAAALPDGDLEADP